MDPSKPDHDDAVLYVERHKESGKCFKYLKTSSSSNPALDKVRVEEMKHQEKQAVTSFFKSVFLPENYPESVSKDYLDYQLWDTAQAFASSISGSLATQAVLKSVGVGDENATPLAATITWLLRTGAGMVGQILFTWIQGCDLDHNCKKWRLFADLLNDSAMMIELSAPFWPQWTHQMLLCFAGIGRSLVGVAGGATRAAITQHQARQNNISDVAAKDGSQETLVNLSALLVNLLILPLIGDDLTMTWILFLFMTGLHLFANYKAVRSLQFETLNRERLLYVLEEIFRNDCVISIEESNRKESVFFGLHLKEKNVLGKSIKLGCSFQRVIDKYGSESPLIRNVIKKIHSEGYFVFVSKLKSARIIESHEEVVNVILSDSITKADVFQAYVEACLVAKLGEDHVMSSYDILERLRQNGYCTDFIQISTLGWTCEQQ